MKRLATATAIMAAWTAGVPAVGENDPVPDRLRQSGITLQRWTFDDGADWPPVYPEEVDNPYGTPYLDSPNHGYEWLESYAGQEGVLHALEWEELVVYVPNRPDAPDGYWKDLWLEVVYHVDGAPGEWTWEPAFHPWESWLIELGDGWWLFGCEYLPYEPNPPQEWLTLLPDPEDPEGDIYLNSIAIHTVCIPEPATLTLWVVAAVVLVRRGG